MIGALVLLVAAAHAATPLHVRLEAGPMLACLERLSAQADVRIVDLSGKASSARCAALEESSTLEETLDRVLAPAGLAWRRNAAGAIEIVAAAPAPERKPAAAGKPRPRGAVRLDPLEVQGITYEDAAPPELPAITTLSERALGMTRIDARWLESAPLTSFEQIGRYAPNLYGSGQSLAIRGIERDSDFFTSLSVTLDGIDLGTRLLDDDLVPLDGVTRIDLARGPRAFETGGGTAAGALRLVTAAPAAAPQLGASASAGTHDAWRAGAGYSGPLPVPGLGASLALERRALPTFVTQALLPEAEQALRYNDSARLKLDYESDAIDGLSAAASALDVSGDTAERWIEQEDGAVHRARRESFAIFAERGHTRGRGAAAALRYDGTRFGAELYGSTTAIRRETSNLPAQDIDLLGLENRYRSGARVRWTPDASWTLAAGFETARVASRDHRIFIEPFESPFPPSVAVRIEPAADEITDTSSNFATRSNSTWLWVEHSFGAHWDAGVGVRWQRERYYTAALRRSPTLSNPDCRVLRVATGTSQPCSDFLNPEIAMIRRADVAASVPIPLATLAWHPSASHAVTLGHGRGYRSGGSVGIAGTYDIERDATTDLAWRARWLDGRLRTSAIVFESTARDRFTYPYPAQADANRGRARARGIELEADVELSERWRVRAGLGLLDSRYIEYSYGPPPDLGGQRTPGAPSATALIGARYGASTGWYGAFDAYHAEDAESGTSNSPHVHRPPYSVVDARVGFRTTHWDASLIATNLTDADYVTRAEANHTNGRLHYRLGDPRQVELRIVWQW